MNYFGTNTSVAGHYFWELNGNSQSKSNMWFRDIPFNPEDFTKTGNYSYKKKGSTEFHFIGGYSILAIAGSPIDKREGCKSVFFLKEQLSSQQLIDRIKSIPAAMKIINQMPFEIDIEGLKD